jgi:competence protein ComEC
LLAAVFEQRWLSRRTYRRFVPLPVGLVLAFFFLGGLRGEMARPPLTALDLATYNDSGRVRLTGEVISAPDRRETSTLLKVTVSQLQPEGGQPLAVRGLVMVRLAPGALFRYGDRLVLDGVPQTPPEDETFSYRDYLARQGILTYINQPQVYLAGRGRTNLFWSFTYGLRERAYRLVNRYYPAPESALLAGILLGLDQDLPEGLAQAYRNTGTAHVIAISGFNMSILAALFLGLFGRVLPRGWAALAAILALAFYSLLVGGNPAVVRAALMGAAAVFGGLVGRRQSGINTLVFTAALMCAFNPFLPWDVSFQLSFSATLGLILYAEPVELAFRRWAARTEGAAGGLWAEGPGTLSGDRVS